MTTFDLVSLFVSSAGHDVDHPGHNNLFETKTFSKLAILYNDVSVLENHHAATLYFLMEKEDCNIFEKIKIEDQGKMRKSIIENILYTDMSKHFPLMGELKTLPSKEDYDPVGKHKPDLIKAMVHAADVGNPSRPFQIYEIWAHKILSEVFS